MGLNIPNSVDATYPAQSMLNSREVDALVAGDNATYVVTGCAVSYHSAGANMSVDVTSGVITSAGTGAYVTAGTLTITTADATNPRIDAVVASAAGILSVVAGTPVAVTTTTAPAIPAISAGSVLLAAVYVPAAATSITATMVLDKRVIQTTGPFFDEHSALRNFRAAKGKATSRSLDVLFLGDSITEGYFATSENTKWQTILRKGLQVAINPPGVPGGEGYVPVIHGTTTNSGYGATAFPDRAVLSGGATAGARIGGYLGLGQRNANITSNTGTITFTTTVCDRFWILYASSATTGNMKIVVDGGASVLHPTYNATDARSGRVWDSGPLTRGVHTIVITADNTATAPANVYNVFVEGYMLFDGDGANGPANQLVPEYANIDGLYDVTAANQFWQAIPGSSWGGCTVARSSTQAYTGTYSMAMTCTGAANPAISSGYLQCRARSRITFSFRVRSSTTVRTFWALISFYTDNGGAVGTYLTTLGGTQVSSTNSGWTTISITTIVPETAGWLSLGPAINGTPVNGEIHYIDALDLGLTSYSGAGVINTAYRDPTSGAAQGRGVRVWDGAHNGTVTSDFTGASSVGLTTTATGMWSDALDAVNPDVVIIGFGTNENYTSVAPATLRDNLITLVNNVRFRACTPSLSIILLAFWPVSATSNYATWLAQDGYRDQIRAAARATGSGFRDVGASFPISVNGTTAGSFPQPNIHDLLFEDGVHASDIGQNEIAQTLLAYLLEGDPRTTVMPPANNYTATTDPAATNDITQGYLVGSRWFNTTKRTVWECTDATASTAVWVPEKAGPFGSLTSTAVTSSTTETVLLTANLPANAWYSGEHIDYEVIGSSSSTGTLIFKVHVGTAGTTSDALAATFTTSAAQVANQRAGVRGKIQCRTTGTSGTVYVDGVAFAGTALLPLVTGAAATATVNTTVAQKITVTCTCSVGTFTAQLGSIG